VVDLGLAALHQVLPHRGNGSRAGEHAIDQRHEILVEYDAISAGHRQALVDDLLLQRVELRIDDRADFRFEQGGGRVNHTVEDRLAPHLLLDVGDDAAVEPGFGQ
jgi:hypothetical protein